MSVLIDYSSGAFAANQAQAVGTITAGAGDVDFADVSLLLHMDGSNGSTTFTDSSSNSVSVTAYGNAQLSTTEKKFGTASGYFDGTGDELRYTSPALSGDFTVEAFVYPESQTKRFPIFIAPKWDTSPSGRIVVSYDPESVANKFQCRVGDNLITPTNTSSAGQWYHIAVVRSGSSVSFFLDGVLQGSQSFSGSIASNTAYIGGVSSNSADNAFKGYIDEFRLTNGVARYTSNFTPPTVAFPNGTSGPINLDISSGDYFNYTPSANTTFTFTNAPASGTAAGFALAVTGANVGEGYDIANASYDSKSFDISGQETLASALFFKPDGTKMYMTGGNADSVFEYDLSTAFDVSTASYNNVSYYYGAPPGITEALFFRADGLKWYSIDRGDDKVFEYNMSTAWDITSSSLNQSLDISNKEATGRGLFFSSDGTKMYICGAGLSTANQYNLSTAWDISTASHSSTFSVSSQDVFPHGISIKSDGTKMYIIGSNTDSVYQYSLSTAYDLSTASYDSVSFSVQSQDPLPFGFYLKPDGTKMYVAGRSNDAIFQYSTSSTAAATFSYPASVEWPTGTAPDGPAIGETDVLVFLTDDGGTSYQGFQAGDAMS